MKLTRVDLDEDEAPKSITVEVSVDEAALLYALTGRVSPKEVTDATGDLRWGTALYEIADCLSGSFFNRYWDAGARAVAPVGLAVVREADRFGSTPAPETAAEMAVRRTTHMGASPDPRQSPDEFDSFSKLGTPPESGDVRD